MKPQSATLICTSLMLMILPACGFSPALNHNSPSRGNLNLTDDSFEERTDEGDRGESTDGTAKPPTRKPRLKCQFELPKEELCGVLRWEHPPAVFKDSPYTIQLWKKGIAVGKDGPFVKPVLGTLTTDIAMPSMGGHPGNGIIAVSSSSVGVYRATHVVFNMGGEWAIRIKIINSANAIVDETKLEIKLDE